MTNPIELQQAKIKIIETFAEVFKCKLDNIKVMSESINYMMIRINISECMEIDFALNNIIVIDKNIIGDLNIPNFDHANRFTDNGNTSTSLTTHIKYHLQQYFNFGKSKYNLLSYIKNTVLG